MQDAWVLTSLLSLLNVIPDGVDKFFEKRVSSVGTIEEGVGDAVWIDWLIGVPCKVAALLGGQVQKQLVVVAYDIKIGVDSSIIVNE